MKKTASPANWPVDISEEKGVRYLHFGSDWVQGAMRVARPWQLELEYTREMLFPLLLKADWQWPKRVLQIGLGAGSVAKFIYRHLPDCRQTIVEINPQLEFVAQHYFKVPQDPPRLRIEIEDGADYLLRQNPPFDLVIVDCFDPDARSGALDTLPLYTAARSHLNNEGIAVFNLLGRNRGFANSVCNIQTAFADQVLVLPASPSGNRIVLGFQSERPALDPALLQARGETLKTASQLDLMPTLQRMASIL